MEDKDVTETFCPNCNDSFVCRKDDITKCQCYAVSLSDQARELLARSSRACLCRSCLEKIESEISTVPKPSTQREKPVLVENIHYYMEGKYFVFTELYHRQRGYCCKNNCRHCAYSEE